MPLVLDLLRHGTALPAAHGGDEARVLSTRGLAEIERLAAHLAGIGWRPDRAFASPLRRARDTATIALREVAPRLAVERMDALLPDSDPAGVVEALTAAGAVSGHVLLVAHQPLLGRLAAHLDGGANPVFSPGTLVRIEFPGLPTEGRGVAGWHLAPGRLGG